MICHLLSLGLAYVMTCLLVCGLEGTKVRARVSGRDFTVADKRHIALRGDHNLANVLAATAVGLLCDCSPECIRQVVGSFLSNEHVLEFVREHEGVQYYNDSKGTNVDATQKALASFDEPILLIIGGKDKGGDFGQLRPLIQQKVKTLILIGEASQRIANSLSEMKSVIMANSLDEAVNSSRQKATSGDVVLFSPACSSFDMFRNYDHRGREFKRLVHEIH